MASSSNADSYNNNNEGDGAIVGDSFPGSNSDSLDKSANSNPFADSAAMREEGYKGAYEANSNPFADSAASPFSSATQIKDDYSAIYFFMYALQAQVLLLLVLVIFLIWRLQNRTEVKHANDHATETRTKRSKDASTYRATAEVAKDSTVVPDGIGAAVSHTRSSVSGV